MSRHTTGLLPSWIALCATAEFFGIGAAAVWYGSVTQLFGEPEPIPARIAVWLAMSLAAAPEGIILGAMQARGISWFLSGVSRQKLVLATVFVGLIGWGIGSFIPMFVMRQAGAEAGADPGLLSTALFAAVFGAGVGLILGLAQSWALPPGIARRTGWTLANIAGWGLGLPIIYIAAQYATEFAAWPIRLALRTVGGLAAGALIGVSTGIALMISGDDEQPA